MVIREFSIVKLDWIEPVRSCAGTWVRSASSVSTGTPANSIGSIKHCRGRVASLHKASRVLPCRLRVEIHVKFSLYLAGSSRQNRNQVG